MNKKAECTIIGISFAILNVYAVLHNHTLFGIGFGIVASIFLVRGLLK